MSPDVVPGESNKTGSAPLEAAGGSHRPQLAVLLIINMTCYRKEGHIDFNMTFFSVAVVLVVDKRLDGSTLAVRCGTSFLHEVELRSIS